MQKAQKSCIFNIIRIIVFEKERFINAKKLLNFIQSLINEKKVIKPPPPPTEIIAELMKQLSSKNPGPRSVFVYRAAMTSGKMVVGRKMHRGLRCKYSISTDFFSQLITQNKYISLLSKIEHFITMNIYHLCQQLFSGCRRLSKTVAS